MSAIALSFDIPNYLPESLPVLALRVGVLLPGGVMPLTIGRPKTVAAVAEAANTSELVLVGVQREPVDDPGPSDLLPIAVLARIVDKRRGRSGANIVVAQGLARVRLKGFPSISPCLRAAFEVVPEAWPETVDAEALHRTFLGQVEEAAKTLEVENRLPGLLRTLEGVPILVDGIAALLKDQQEWLKEILQTLDPMTRARAVLSRLSHTMAVVSAEQAIREKLESEAQEQGREQILRRRLKAIQEELGEVDDDLAQLRGRIDKRDLPETVSEAVEREFKRLDRLNPSSAERSVALDWLEWVADLPWNTFAGIDLDLRQLEELLDESHHGLEDVKEQVVEHLAVTQLSGKGRADVLLLIGPPGVGKTSIGQAVADATGRKLVRVALGGVRDEAELRGHRRTYIGARPGRLIEGIRRAGTADPVVLLDEIDKLAVGYQGDPSAALLEILDPEQNSTFTDHYMEVPFDLSKCLFIATANDASRIRGPLRDRMETIEIAGYTREEKAVIARKHLLQKLARNAGVETDDVVFSDEVVKTVIDGWTREAGVRQLQRVLGKLYRAAAVKKARKELDAPLEVTVDDLPNYLKRRRFFEEEHDLDGRPGIATGLAWTPLGGDVLYVEASLLPGSGKLVLTGQLGEVMKESARAALTYVLSNAATLGIEPGALDGKDLHIHVPAGAVPKDGPSAGVTMFAAVASLLSGRAVAQDVAMTGEATLRGRVLPVGGIKSKVLAAHRRGLQRVVLPRRNEYDLEDVPQDAREALTFIFADHMEDVLRAVLESEEAVAAKAWENALPNTGSNQLHS